MNKRGRPTREPSHDEREKVKEQQDIPTKENPDVALQKKTPEPQPEKPKPSEAQLAAPVTTAPQMSRVEIAAVAAAPGPRGHRSAQLHGQDPLDSQRAAVLVQARLDAAQR